MEIRTFKTGIAPLDYALPEGFPIGATVAITGSPGSGKSVMVVQLAWNVLKAGGSVVYVNLDDSPDALIELFSNFGWELDKFIDGGRFGIIDCFSFRLGKLKKRVPAVVKEAELEDMDIVLHDIYEAVSNMDSEPKIVIIDSINELMFRFDMVQVLEFIKTTRAVISKGRGATVIITLHTNTEVLRELAAHLEYLIDGLIDTRIEPNLQEIGIPLRQLMVKKMRGLPTNSLWIPYVIVNDGIRSVDPAKLALLIRQKMKEAEAFKVTITGEGHESADKGK